MLEVIFGTDRFCRVKIGPGYASKKDFGRVDLQIIYLDHGSSLVLEAISVTDSLGWINLVLAINTMHN